MRRSGLLAFAVLALAGCGSGAPQGPSLAVTVPVDGSTVLTPHIDMVGTASPGIATVRVGGRLVRVRAGTFTAQLRLHRGVNHFRVVAVSAGNHPLQSELTVRYRPQPPPMPPTLTQQINAICQNANTQALLLPKVSDAAGMVKDFRGLVVMLNKMVSRFAAVLPPAAQTREYQSFVTSERGIATGYNDLLNAAEANSKSGVASAVAALRKASPVAQNWASALGFNQCIDVSLPTN
jgi:hypothetical protein